jgi:hypothetical protein
MSKMCFVIAPIGDKDSDTRRRSDTVLRHIIVPAATECGYEAVRADQIAEPGIITTQVIQHVVDAPLVIADLTGWNPNVFYELAIRHALQAPLIQMIRLGDPLPFDVAGMRTIEVDEHSLDSAAEARAEIVRYIRSVEARGGVIDNPISIAHQLKALRQSDKPQERSLAELLSAVADIAAGVTEMKGRLAGLEREMARQRGEQDRVQRDVLLQLNELGRDARPAAERYEMQNQKELGSNE